MYAAAENFSEMKILVTNFKYLVGTLYKNAQFTELHNGQNYITFFKSW